MPSLASLCATVSKKTGNHLARQVPQTEVAYSTGPPHSTGFGKKEARQVDEDSSVVESTIRTLTVCVLASAPKHQSCLMSICWLKRSCLYAAVSRSRFFTLTLSLRRGPDLRPATKQNSSSRSRLVVQQSQQDHMLVFRTLFQYLRSRQGDKETRRRRSPRN